MGEFYSLCSGCQRLTVDFQYIYADAFFQAKKKATPKSGLFLIWLREPDLNRRPSGYEPDE
ncbi:MAG: hypothetical protein RSE94_18605, partial [Pseudomonas sp.]